MEFYPLPDFRRKISLKDILLCELFCQAEVISDREAQQLIDCVNNGSSMLFGLLALGFTHAELLLGRKLVVEYLDDTESMEKYIFQARAICRRQPYLFSDSRVLSA
jgi:hypothetical protein